MLSAEARARLLELRFVSGVALVLVLAAPWFVYMGFRFRDAFIGGYLLDENIRLYAADRFTPTASSSVWFYFRVLAAGLLPWTGIIVGRLYDDVRAAWRRDGSLDPVDVLLWSWTIAIVGFFTFSRFKLDHYVFPTAPTLCLLCARAWVALRDRPDDPRNAGARIGLWLVGPLLLVVAAAGGYMLIARLALPVAALVVPAAVGGAGLVLTCGVTVKRRPAPAVPWVVFGALTVTYAGLVLVGAPGAGAAEGGAGPGAVGRDAGLDDRSRGHLSAESLEHRVPVLRRAPRRDDRRARRGVGAVQGDRAVLLHDACGSRTNSSWPRARRCASSTSARGCGRPRAACCGAAASR